MPRFATEVKRWPDFDRDRFGWPIGPVPDCAPKLNSEDRANWPRLENAMHLNVRFRQRSEELDRLTLLAELPLSIERLESLPQKSLTKSEIKLLSSLKKWAQTLAHGDRTRHVIFPAYRARCQRTALLKALAAEEWERAVVAALEFGFNLGRMEERDTLSRVGPSRPKRRSRFTVWDKAFQRFQGDPKNKDREPHSKDLIGLMRKNARIRKRNSGTVSNEFTEWKRWKKHFRNRKVSLAESLEENASRAAELFAPSCPKETRARWEAYLRGKGFWT